jgi:iron-sulfur cluster assembly protein
MALDELKDSDDVYEFQGIQYIVDKEFLQQATPITVDFKEVGFSISSSIDLGASCGDCGTKGSCCS